MNIRIGIFGFLLGMAVLTATAAPGVYGEEKVYTVKKGETFFSIAQSLGLKANDLMKYNGITDPARLQAGQRLKIPDATRGSTATGASTAASGSTAPAGSTVPAAKTGAYTMYRAVRGDTFYSIAQRFSVTVDVIREANSLPGNYMLREGDSLRIPAGAGSPAGSGILADPMLHSVAGPSQSSAASGDVSDLVANVSPASAPRETGTGTANAPVRWPIASRDLSYMTGKLSGVVITGTRSESVKSLTWGTVLSAGPYRGFGKVAIVQVEGGYLYVYGGCESLSVKEGDKVGPGTELGILGVDAVSNKPQLFFMVYRSNTPIDPAKAPRA